MSASHCFATVVITLVLEAGLLLTMTPGEALMGVAVKVLQEGELTKDMVVSVGLLMLQGLLLVVSGLMVYIWLVSRRGRWCLVVVVLLAAVTVVGILWTSNKGSHSVFFCRALCLLGVTGEDHSSFHLTKGNETINAETVKYIPTTSFSKVKNAAGDTNVNEGFASRSKNETHPNATGNSKETLSKSENASVPTSSTSSSASQGPKNVTEDPAGNRAKVEDSFVLDDVAKGENATISDGNVTGLKNVTTLQENVISKVSEASKEEDKEKDVEKKKEERKTEAKKKGKRSNKKKHSPKRGKKDDERESGKKNKREEKEETEEKGQNQGKKPTTDSIASNNSHRNPTPPCSNIPALSSSCRAWEEGLWFSLVAGVFVSSLVGLGAALFSAFLLPARAAEGKAPEENKVSSSSKMSSVKGRTRKADSGKTSTKQPMKHKRPDNSSPESRSFFSSSISRAKRSFPSIPSSKGRTVFNTSYKTKGKSFTSIFSAKMKNSFLSTSSLRNEVTSLPSTSPTHHSFLSNYSSKGDSLPSKSSSELRSSSSQPSSITWSSGGSIYKDVKPSNSKFTTTSNTILTPAVSPPSTADITSTPTTTTPHIVSRRKTSGQCCQVI